MTERGDVLRLKRRLGFAPKGEGSAVVVVQAAKLNAILPTVVVVPLDPALHLYNGHPAVRVSRLESGLGTDQAAVVTQVRAISGADIAPGVVGRLSRVTLAQIDRTLRLVLGL